MPESALAHKPAELTFAEASAIPQAGAIALQGTATRSGGLAGADQRRRRRVRVLRHPAGQAARRARHGRRQRRQAGLHARRSVPTTSSTTGATTSPARLRRTTWCWTWSRTGRCSPTGARSRPAAGIGAWVARRAPCCACSPPAGRRPPHRSLHRGARREGGPGPLRATRRPVRRRRGTDPHRPHLHPRGRPPRHSLTSVRGAPSARSSSALARFERGLTDRTWRYREEMADGSSVQDVIARLRRIDDELPPGDGAAVFNRMYLTVTETVAAGLEATPVFVDPVFMEHLDVTFASLWIKAYDADGRRRAESLGSPVRAPTRPQGAAHPVRSRRDELPHRARPRRRSHPDLPTARHLAGARRGPRRLRGGQPAARGKRVQDPPLLPHQVGQSWTPASTRWSTSSTRGRSTRPVTSPGSTSRPCGRSVTSARWPSAIGQRWPARSAWRRAAC